MTKTVTVGLDPARIAGLRGLVGEITNKPLDASPWLAPALLFSEPASQIGIEMPTPDANEILVHDYQSITHHSQLPAGVDLLAEMRRNEKGPTTEIDISITDGGAPGAALKIALRRVPRQDFAALAPTRFTEAQISGLVSSSAELAISQAQIDAYVALSGDENPIHSNPAEARSLGLAAPIVPGLLLAAAVQPFVPGLLFAMKCRFMAPLCADEPFKIAVLPRAPGRVRALIYGRDRRGLAIADLQGKI